MKKALFITALIALTGATMALTGCCGSGSCPVSKKEAMCKCGNPKGSDACKAACMKTEKCSMCGNPKGSDACKAACMK